MPRHNGNSGDAAQLSVEDAKLQLLGWSAEADEELHQQIQGYMDAARAKTRKVVPWATAGGVLLSLLLGARRKKKRTMWESVSSRRGRDEDEPSRTHWVQTAFRVGMFVLPIVRTYMANRRRRY